MPERVPFHHVAMGVLAEVAQQVALEPNVMAPQPPQGGLQGIDRVRKSTIGITGAIPFNLGDP
jgi:hypothetical protein